ncbi:MAG: hypothetical protein Q8R28_18570 [Dehalococcoidia bacterium]|nr:hypothetical protein [Dehalococcoidia bacterium]
MRLPNADKARVDYGKITDYLLSLSHPDGRNKAAFFMAFGFRVEEPEVLKQALQHHGAIRSVTGIAESRFGKRYTVEGTLETPDGRNPTVRTVWILANESDAPRLITAYPA